MKDKIKKIIVAVLAVLAIVAVVSLFSLKKENNRLEDNIDALNASVDHYMTSDSLNAASVMDLQVKASELEAYNADLYDQCKSLDIKCKRLESASEQATSTTIYVDVPIHDTILIDTSSIDTLKTFKWKDNWCSVEGLINNDSVRCSVSNKDTLMQIVHREPHHWWFFKWGCKSIRQEIVSKNPHTEIVYSEHLTFR